MTPAPGGRCPNEYNHDEPETHTYTVTIEAIEGGLSDDDVRAFESWIQDVLSTADFGLRVTWG